VAARKRRIEKCNDLKWNRARNLAACSIVPLPHPTPISGPLLDEANTFSSLNGLNSNCHITPRDVT
jgi:hypothetical protein